MWGKDKLDEAAKESVMSSGGKDEEIIAFVGKGVEVKGADDMMKHLTGLFHDLLGKTFLNGSFTVKTFDNFQYEDPFDRSITYNQGIRVVGSDGSRVIFRLSGTGSCGATVRIYFEKYESSPDKLFLEPEEALKDLIEFALTTSKLQEFTGRKSPTVIT